MTGRWFHDTLGTPTQGTLLPLLFDVKYLDFETFCGGVQCSISECWRCGWSSGRSSWATARRRRSNIAQDRKSTRLNSSHGYISYAVFCLKKKKMSNNEEQAYAI